MAKFTKDTFKTSSEFSRDCCIVIEVLEKVHTAHKGNISKAGKAVYDAVDDIDKTSAAYEYLLEIACALSMTKKDRLITKFNKLKCLYDDDDEYDEDALIEYDSLEQKIVDRIKRNVKSQCKMLLFDEMQRLKAIYRIKNMSSIEEVFANFPLQFENVLRDMFGNIRPDGTFSTVYLYDLDLTSTLNEMIESCIQYVFKRDKYAAYNTIKKLLSDASVTVLAFTKWNGGVEESENESGSEDESDSGSEDESDSDSEDESDSEDDSDSEDGSGSEDESDSDSEDESDSEPTTVPSKKEPEEDQAIKKVYEQLSKAYVDGNTVKYKKLNELLTLLLDM